MNQNININLEKNAFLEFFSFFSYNFSSFDRSYLFNLLRAELKEKSQLNIFASMEGAMVEHNDFKISLNEKNAICNLHGLFLLKKKNQAHINVFVDHKAPYTESYQLVKGMLKDFSRSSFEATVYIDKNAEKSTSKQLNKNLLLSENAEAFSKPFLRVYSDDVKASHGATIYRLEEEELFYLTSRGINAKQACLLLIKGFCQEIINTLNIKSLKDKLSDRLSNFLR